MACPRKPLGLVSNPELWAHPVASPMQACLGRIGICWQRGHREICWGVIYVIAFRPAGNIFSEVEGRNSSVRPCQGLLKNHPE